MNSKLVLILQSIQTLHILESQLSSRFGWMHFREKKECKRLKTQLTEKINSLAEDKWTVDYLHKLQRSLKAFYIVLSDYMDDKFYIAGYNPNYEENKDLFFPMYFTDEQKSDRLIILDVVSDNITFRIVDTVTGNSFSTTSVTEVQESQKKIESVCKHCLIAMILRYMNNQKE